MRAVHRYYKHHYNKLLKLRQMDDTQAPSIDKIQYCYESLGKRVLADRGTTSEDLRGQYQKYFVNHDMGELSMTKDVLDFDKNFLRHLKVSIESTKQ